MDRINAAIVFIANKHNGQTRKDGSPYIWHPIRVAMLIKEWGYSDEYQLAGLFHDLLEDTDATESEILELSNSDVLDAVKLLTRTSYNVESYIDDILGNDIAKVVKTADRIHNLQEAHTASPDFIKRYLEDTKDHYLGKFGSDLDNAYYELLDYYRSL